MVLRGCSQICFQSNELTGLFFLAAVLVASPLAAVYFLIAATVAPGARMLLGERGPVLATGITGLNPCLIALSLPVFFETGWGNVGMWVVLIVCVLAAVLLVWIFVKILPFPFLALPFVLLFWTLYTLSPSIDAVQPADLSGSSEMSSFHPLVAVLQSLGQTLFSLSPWSGLLFITGVFLSNWRHGVVALMGASMATLTSYYYGHADVTAVNLGLLGFNGVLAAVGIYVLCGEDLRLAILGAVTAAILTPAMADLGAVVEAGLQAACMPFLLATWLVLGLGRIDETWFAQRRPSNKPREKIRVPGQGNSNKETE